MSDLTQLLVVKNQNASFLIWEMWLLMESVHFNITFTKLESLPQHCVNLSAAETEEGRNKVH